MPGPVPAPQKIGSSLKQCILNPRSRSARDELPLESTSEPPPKNGLRSGCKKGGSNGRSREKRKGSCPQILISGANPIRSWTPEARRSLSKSSTNEPITTRKSRVSKPSRLRETEGIISSPVSQAPAINLVQDFEVVGSEIPQEAMKRFLMEIFMRSTTAGSGHQILVDQLGYSQCTDFGISDYLSEKGAEDDGNETEAENLILDIPPHRFSDSELSEGSIEPMSVTLDTILKLEPGFRDLSTKASAEYREGEEDPWIKSQSYMLTSSRNPSKPFLRHISLPAPHFMALSKDEACAQSGSTGQLIEESFKRRYLTEQYTKLMSRLASISVENIDSGRSGKRMNRSTSSLGKLLQRAYSISSHNNANWSRSTSISIDDFRELGLGDFDGDMSMSGTEVPFATQLEKQAITMRSLRRLKRQETMRNFAPADFCNT